MEDVLNCYVLPISGGCFVSQVALLMEVYSAKKLLCGGKFKSSKEYQPDLVLSSSGGNISAYVALAGDWNEEGIIRVVKELSHEMFVESWMPQGMNFIPSWTFSPLYGTIYKKGSGVKKLFNKLFTKSTVQRVEIWTGTYDETNKKAQFMCNKEQQHSMLNKYSFCIEENTFRSMPLMYLNGDLNSLAIISIASASIPFIVGPQEFNGNKYSDGGIMYSSPLTPLSSEICKCLFNKEYTVPETKNDFYEFDDDNNLKEITEKKKQIKKKLRLVYFAAYELLTNNSAVQNNITNLYEIFNKIYESNTLQDIANAKNLLNMIGDSSQKIESKKYYSLTSQKLSEIFKEMENFDHYVMILYCKGCVKTSITKIDMDDLLNKIEIVRKNYNAEIFYF